MGLDGHCYWFSFAQSVSSKTAFYLTPTFWQSKNKCSGEKNKGRRKKKTICLVFEHPSTKFKSYLYNHYLHKESVLKSKSLFQKICR